MVAVVQVEEISNGTGIGDAYFTVKDASGSPSRYYTADNSSSSLTTNPIPIPTEDAGYSGSYWKTHCINATSPATEYIKDIRWYITIASSNVGDQWLLGTSGDLVIGISNNTIAEAKASTQGFPSSAYEPSDGVEGTFGYFITDDSNGHSYYNDASTLSGGATSTCDFTSLADAYYVQAGNLQGVSGGRSYCIATQVIVGSGATQGVKPDITATFVYSEV